MKGGYYCRHFFSSLLTLFLVTLTVASPRYVSPRYYNPRNFVPRHFTPRSNEVKHKTSKGGILFCRQIFFAALVLVLLTPRQRTVVLATFVLATKKLLVTLILATLLLDRMQ